MLISGGVGQSPLISMLDYLVSTGNQREIVWVHSSRNATVHAFKEQIDALHAQQKRFKRHIFYGILDDQQTEEAYYPGIVNPGQLNEEAILPGAD